MSLMTTRYAHFFTHCHTLFSIIDCEGYFLQVNNAWQVLLGYDTEALSNSLYLHFIHPDDQLKTANIFKELATNSESATVINRFQHSDGSYHEIIWQITLVSQTTEFYVVAIDTTSLLSAYSSSLSPEDTRLLITLEKNQQELATLQVELQDKQIALNVAQEDNVELSAQIEDAQQHLTLLQTHLQSKQTALLSLQEDNMALNTHLEKAQQSLATLQVELEEKQAELNWLDEQNRVLQAGLAQVRAGAIVQYADGQLQALNPQAEEIFGRSVTTTDFECLWRADDNTSDRNVEQLIQLNQAQEDLLTLSVQSQALYHQDENQPYAKVITFYNESELDQTEISVPLNQDDIPNKPMGVLDWDLTTNQVTCSANWKNIFGYSEEAVCIHIDAWYSRIHPSDHYQVIQAVKNCLDNVTSLYEKTHRVQHHKGSYRWVTSQGIVLRDNRGQPLRFIVTFIDLTESNYTKPTLAEKYEQLFTRYPDALLLIEHNGIIVDANPAALNLYGYTSKEIVQLTSADLFVTETHLAPQLIHNGYHQKQDGTHFLVEMRVNEWHWQAQHLFVVTVREVNAAQQPIAQLSNSEKQYRQLFNTESEAIIVFDAKTQQIIDVNKLAIQLYGYSRPEWLACHITTLFDKANHNEIDEIDSACLEPVYKIPLAWHRKKDNTRFPVEIITSQYQIQQRTLVCAIVRDITTYQQAQEFANTLLQASPVFFVVLSTTYKIIFVNDTLLKVLGYTLAEVRDQDYQATIVSSKDAPRVADNFATLLKQPETKVLMEITVLTKTHQPILLECHCRAVLDAQQQIAYILNIGIDARERKEAQQQLHLYKSIVETSQEAIFVSTLDAQLVYINPAHEKLFKFQNFVPKKYNYRNYCTPETLTTIEQEIEPKIVQGQTWEGVLQVFDTQGRHFPIWGRFDALRDEQGHFLYTFGLMHDVTEQQEMEMNLRYEHEQYETIFNAAPLSIIYKDKENRVIKANRYAAQVAKFNKPLEIEGRSVYELLPQYADEYYANDLEVIKTGKPKLGLREKHSGGYSQVDKIPYKDAQGNIAGVIVFSVDITRRLRTERVWRQKQQALRESEAQLRLAIEHLPVMIWAIDMHKNIIIWNRNCEQMTGYTADEIVHQPQAWQLLYPDADYREHIIQSCQQQLEHQGEFCQFEWHLTSKKGIEKTITWSVINIIEVEGSSLWATGQEITRREQKAVKLLRENEDRLRLIIQQMPIMFVAYDDSGQFLFWNQQCEKVTGYTADQIIGKLNALKLLYPQPELCQKIQQFCLQQPDYWQYETEISCKDGTRKQIIWSNISQQYPIPGWFGWMIGEDITALKKMHADFNEKDSLLSAVLDSFQTGICVTDRRGRFVYLNEGYGNLHGYGAEELINCPLTVVIPPDKQNIALRQYFSFLNQTEGREHIETHTALHKRGFLIDVHSVAQRIERDNGQVYVLWLVSQIEGQ